MEINCTFHRVITQPKGIVRTKHITIQDKQNVQ